ncbi:MAG TPA: tetratricopeptide repeat protein [Gemmatimonadales bacterium]|nr:tetratricopeptide repeat protein [Gemmatimonadales bacterium]
MSRGPLTALGAGLAVFAAIALLQARADRSGEAPGAAGETMRGTAGVREFWAAYREATAHRMAGRVVDARDAYRKALALNAVHEDALYYLGNMELELGEYAGAEAAWRRLIEVNPVSARAHSRLGDLYACMDSGAPHDLGRAEAEFRRALEINREETGPLLRLGEIALIRGDLIGAEGFLNAVIGSHAKSVEAHFLKGYAAWKRAQPERASTFLRDAVALAHSVRIISAVPSEGDTKRGLVPAAVKSSRCRLFEAEIEQLSSLDSTTVATRTDEVYQELDRRLAQIPLRRNSQTSRARTPRRDVLRAGEQ